MWRRVGKESSRGSSWSLSIDSDSSRLSYVHHELYIFLLRTLGEGNNERHNVVSGIDFTMFADEQESNHVFLGIKIASNFPLDIRRG